MQRTSSFSENEWDVIIVGQGLAGTTLAWHLHQAGQKVLLLDPCEAVTTSKIAAGLLTPVTGKRLALSDRYEDYLSVAVPFYRHIEQLTGQPFFHDRTAVRLLQSDAERTKWEKRRDEPAYQAHLVDPQPDPLVDPAIAAANGGGFAMRSAQLDVAAYLNASRSVLPSEQTRIDWKKDITFASDGVHVGRYTTSLVVSCEGYAASRNPYFSDVPFRAAKGDILTVRFNKPLPQRTLHHGVWVAPTNDPNVFSVGAPYNWDTLDQTPEASAQSEIEDKLRAFMRVPYTVLDHRAAVRPILRGTKKPLIGRHPTQDQLAYFNGLGSKGSLMAPWYARALTNHLLKGAPIADEINLQHHLESGRV